ncbi:MAG: hypothetical protein R3F37_12205 [Candidatus Competibacteraceae bacterium]
MSKSFQRVIPKRNLEEKKQLYFDRGAQEVVSSAQRDTSSFYDWTGAIAAPRYFPNSLS